MNTKHWLKGLAGAIIGSIASSIALVITDPQTFNIHAGLGKLGETALVTGILNAAFYLKQSPVPPDDTTPTK